MGSLLHKSLFQVSLLLGPFTLDARVVSSAIKESCHSKLATRLGVDNFYIYLQEGNLDAIIRGSYPWSDREGPPVFVRRAREFIASKKELSQQQNIRLWEAFVERVSYYSQGHMKNFKLTRNDGTVIYYSDLLGKIDGVGGTHFHYFAFTPDGSMYYGTKKAKYFPMTSAQRWMSANEEFQKLK